MINKELHVLPGVLSQVLWVEPGGLGWQHNCSANSLRGSGLRIGYFAMF